MKQALTDIDAIAVQLSSRKAAWLNVSPADRIVYLQRCIDDVLAVASEWATAACCAKGIDPMTMLAGEEWFVGPTVTIANLQGLIQALRAQGKPTPRRVESHFGQTVATVFPNGVMESLLWRGFTGEVWMAPGQAATQGCVNHRSTSGTLALVLGAGNVSSIAPMDALYKLFVEDAVVLLKLNPVNDYMGPILAKALQCLRQDSFFEVVYGGADVGSYLCQHPLVDTIHITGSHQTYDAIVWGTGPEQHARKQARQPHLTKPVTAELGCVTPILVVPGDWSPADLAFQARHVAGMVAHNASFNCAAAKVIVTAQGWAQRDAFLTCLRQELAATPTRKAYYPGAQQRYQSFLEHYPQAIALPSQKGSPDALPWTFIPDVPAQVGEYALTQEAFCGVLAAVSLPVTTSQEFLAQAIVFANESIWGNLSCTLLIDPQTQRQCATELETAIAQLRYGAIGINVWSAVIFSLPVLPWGAFPGNSPEAIASGQGVVHNTYLFQHPQKAVLRAPFRIAPLPIWFARHGNLRQLAQRFLYFQAAPNWRHWLRVVLAALRG